MQVEELRASECCLKYANQFIIVTYTIRCSGLLYHQKNRGRILFAPKHTHFPICPAAVSA